MVAIIAISRKKKDIDKQFITPHIKQLIRKKSVAKKVLQTAQKIRKIL